MELEQNQIAETVTVNANAIICKYKNKKDRMLFCHEKNWWHPEEPGFDSTYFLQVFGLRPVILANFLYDQSLTTEVGQQFFI